MTDSKPSKPLKLVFGVKPPTKSQRRANMLESAQHNQVRYFGLHKVDNVIVKMLTQKKEPKENIKNLSARELFIKASAFKTKIKHLAENIEKEKRNKNNSQVLLLEKQLETAKKDLEHIIPIFNKQLIKEQKDEKQDDKPIKKQDDKPIKKQDDKPVKKQDDKPIKKSVKKPVNK
jgi:hypothetical protein